ncbi:MAG: hypothetical protein AB1650_06655 [Candidatus Omnitrophota bacterium]
MKPQEDEVELTLLIKIFYKNIWRIILITFIAMLVSGIEALRQPRLYEAWTSAFTTEMEYDLETLGGSIERPAISRSNLIVSILESRTMTDRVIEKLDLKTVWGKKAISDVRKRLRMASRISLEKNGLIKMSVRTKSPQLSADIANAYVDNLDFFNNELSIGPQKQIVQIIDRAVVPEEPLPRGTAKKIVLVGITAFLIVGMLVLSVEFSRKFEILKRIKE